MFKPKLGDFVTANVAVENVTRQGVYVKKDPDGTIIIEGMSGRRYRCTAKGILIIPDGNVLAETLTGIMVIRAKLKWAKGLFY
jgi:hypothetical protein